MADAAPAIQRARRCLAEGRGVLAGDLAALLNRVDHLERELAVTASLRRKADRNRAVSGLADRLCPGLGHWAAARRLKRLATQPGELLPEEAEILDLSDDQLARVILEAKRTPAE